MTYDQAMQFLGGLQWTGIQLGLERVQALLEQLQHPQRSLKVVHIAGTNGKGSTAAIVSSILRAGGYRVGLFISPHVEDFRERIQINGRYIPCRRVVALTLAICRLLEVDPAHPHKMPLTYFEFVTAMALLYFCEERVQVAVIEVGLGGRLDATNVVTPLLSVITSVDYDHTAYLGTTLREIAYEKSRIIKAGTVALVGECGAEALSVIRQRCDQLRVPCYLWPHHFRAKAVGKDDRRQHLDFYHGQERVWKGLALPLLGRHQLINAALAIEACFQLQHLGLGVSAAAMQRGMAGVRWPGRLQVVALRPRVVLDGAHNPAAAHYLGLAIRDHFSYQRLYLVFAMLSDKDVIGFAKRMVPLAEAVIVTRPKVDRAADPVLLSHALRPMAKELTVVEEVGEALALARSLANPSDLICVTGSLYLVAEVLALLRQGGERHDQQRLC